MDEPAELRVSARMAPHHHQEAADPFRLGPDEGSRAAARGAHRDRRRRGQRGRCGLDHRAPACAARTGAAAGDVAAAVSARVVVGGRCAGGTRRRRQARHRVEERSGARSRAVAHPRFRPTARARRCRAALEYRRVRVALRGRVFERRHPLANDARVERRPRRAGRDPAARVGDALRAPRAARRTGGCVRARGDRSARSRVRRIAQRVLRSDRARIAARNVPARLFGRAILLDGRRHRWRQRHRPAVRGRRTGSRERRLFDRAVRAVRNACRDVGGCAVDAGAAGRLPADAERHVARPAMDAARDGLRVGNA